MTCVRFLASVLVIVSLSAPTDGLADRFRLTLDGPMVPYERVEYTVERKHGAIVASVSTTAPAGFGENSRIALVTDREWVELSQRLQPNISNLRARSRAHPTTVRYTLEVPVHGRLKTFVINDPEFADEQTSLRVIDTIREFVIERTGTLTFWDSLLLPDEAGTLRVRSEPAGWIRVNGFALGQQTPINSLKLPVGEHVVDISHPESGERWAYPIRIKAGRTTLLNVTLK